MARLPVLLLAACSTVSLPEVEPGEAMPYVPVARAATWQQRWIVDRAGTEIVFTLLLRVEPPLELHFVALGDFGGTLAEGTLKKVTRDSRAVPAATATAIRDVLSALYLPPARADLRAVRIKESGEAGAWAPGRRELWSADGLWTRAARVRVHGWSGEPRWPARYDVSGSVHATVEARPAP
jgi:hypothetical protein